jgi:hypothetical protein
MVAAFRPVELHWRTIWDDQDEAAELADAVLSGFELAPAASV